LTSPNGHLGNTNPDGWWGDAGNLGTSSKHADRQVAILTHAQEHVNINHGPSLCKFAN